jgi:hypothetical protein
MERAAVERLLQRELNCIEAVLWLGVAIRYADMARLEVAIGKVAVDACYPRHTNVDFLTFLKLVAKARLACACASFANNYATHKHTAVRAWLDKTTDSHCVSRRRAARG